jgi:hypothetical protein
LEDPQDQREPPNSLSEKLGQFLRTATVIVMEFSELALSKGRAAYDWVKGQIQQRLGVGGSNARGFGYGYAPVGQTALDDEIDADPTLLDLDDY